MKTKIFSILLLALASLSASAQQDPMITQYMSNQVFINPAYAGSHDYSTLSALYRKQWVEFPGAPKTGFLTYDTRFKCSNIGMAFTFVNDRLGISERSDLSGIFTYHVRTSSKGQLSLGIKASIGYYDAKLTELKVWDANDQTFANDVLNKWVPNVGLGAYYYTDKFYLGAALPGLLRYRKPSEELASISLVPNFQRHYFVSSGYVFALPSDVYLKPSVLVKYTNDAPVEADLNLNVFFMNRFSLGAGYRTKDGLVAMAEMYVTKNIRIGYAYDYPLTSINNFSSGTHEVMVAYDFVRDLIKMKTPRFF
ncbi:MAG: type IX secretion system membrane protein PorP/SprF [Bacteroidota bacterium]